MTFRQQAYLNSPHVNGYLKEVMRLQLSIRNKENAMFMKMGLNEKAEALIEKSQEIIDALIEKGYSANNEYIKQEENFINEMSQYL